MLSRLSTSPVTSVRRLSGRQGDSPSNSSASRKCMSPPSPFHRSCETHETHHHHTKLMETLANSASRESFVNHLLCSNDAKAVQMVRFLSALDEHSRTSDHERSNLQRQGISLRFLGGSASETYFDQHTSMFQGIPFVSPQRNSLADLELARIYAVDYLLNHSQAVSFYLEFLVERKKPRVPSFSLG